MADRPRLLAKGNGYTSRPSSAMDPAEPEAVSAEDQRTITLGAARAWPQLNALQQGARASAPLARRIERCKAQARHLGVDIHPQMRVLRLAMEGGRSEQHIERRVERIEATLWPSRSGA